LLIFSGFVPTVDRWEPDLSRNDMPAFIAHGRQDPIMSIDFGRQARAMLGDAGFPVDYHESDAAHFIDPDHVPSAVKWLSEQL